MAAGAPVGKRMRGDSEVGEEVNVGGGRMPKMARNQQGGDVLRRHADGLTRERDRDVRDRGRERDRGDRDRDMLERERERRIQPDNGPNPSAGGRPSHQQKQIQQHFQSQQQQIQTKASTALVQPLPGQVVGSQKQLLTPQQQALLMKGPLPPHLMHHTAQQQQPPPGWPTPEMLSHLPFPPSPFPMQNFNVAAAAAAAAANGLPPGHGHGGMAMRGRGGALVGVGVVRPTGNVTVPLGVAGSVMNNKLGVASGPGNVSSPGGSGGGGRFRHFILLARNIPEDKMMIGPIISFFQQFGNLLDVVRVQPDKAFILFERREAASAALGSVDAIMGNRHIRLSFGRENDFTEASLQLTDDGKLVPADKDNGAGKNDANDARVSGSAQRGMGARRGGFGRGGGRGGRGGGGHASAVASPAKVKDVELENGSGDGSATSLQQPGTEVGTPRKAEKTDDQQQKNQAVVVDPKAAAEDLKRKKEKIIALRKQQEARKSQLQSRYEGLVKQQRDLLESLSDKKNDAGLMKRFREIQKEAMQVRSELTPKTPTTSSVQQQQQTIQACKDISRESGVTKILNNKRSLVVDNRPKNMLIVGCDVSVGTERAKNVFRETVKVAKVDDGWLIEFSSRRAAESAMRAVGPLKRGFGDSTTAQIVATALPEVGPENCVSVGGANIGSVFGGTGKNRIGFSPGGPFSVAEKIAMMTSTTPKAAFPVSAPIVTGAPAVNSTCTAGSLTAVIASKELVGAGISCKEGGNDENGEEKKEMQEKKEMGNEDAGGDVVMG